MANDHSDVRGLLGLALRAGKLVLGDDPVSDLIKTGHARALFLANDAGDAIRRKAGRLAAEREIPVLATGATKAELGAALGRASCALCAVSDMGFAASAAGKLAALSPENAAAAELLSKKNDRMQARKARPKKKGAGAKVTEYIDIEEDDFKRRFGNRK